MPQLLNLQREISKDHEIQPLYTATSQVIHHHSAGPSESMLCYLTEFSVSGLYLKFSVSDTQFAYHMQFGCHLLPFPEENVIDLAVYFDKFPQSC